MQSFRPHEKNLERWIAPKAIITNNCSTEYRLTLAEGFSLPQREQ